MAEIDPEPRLLSRAGAAAAAASRPRRRGTLARRDFRRAARNQRFHRSGRPWPAAPRVDDSPSFRPDRPGCGRAWRRRASCSGSSPAACSKRGSSRILFQPRRGARLGPLPIQLIVDGHGLPGRSGTRFGGFSTAVGASIAGPGGWGRNARVFTRAPGPTSRCLANTLRSPVNFPPSTASAAGPAERRFPRPARSGQAIGSLSRLVRSADGRLPRPAGQPALPVRPDPIDQEDFARPLVSIAPQISALLIDGGPDADALEGRATFPIDQQNRIADFLLALYGEDPDALISESAGGAQRHDEPSRRLAIKRALLGRLDRRRQGARPGHRLYAPRARAGVSPGSSCAAGSCSAERPSAAAGAGRG